MTTAAATELHTLRDFLRYAVSRFRAANLFFGHGSDNAWDEAVYLTLHTLHLPLDRLEPFLDASLTHGESEQVQAVIERRVRERLETLLEPSLGVLASLFGRHRERILGQGRANPS